MADELTSLPRLGEDTLGPCADCGKVMLASGAPLFYRITVQQCGIDKQEVQRHVGLAMTMGGGADGLALAGALGPTVKPVIEMQKAVGNICMLCSGKHLTIMTILAQDEDEDKDG